MKKNYRILGFLGILLTVWAMGNYVKNCNAKETQDQYSITKEGITYSYTVTDKWNDGYIAEFVIKNETLQVISFI